MTNKPILLTDFPLEKHIEGMSPEEAKTFYHGFCVCLKAFIRAMDGVYPDGNPGGSVALILPKENDFLLKKITEQMIQILDRHEGN
jgi:hypothetical protein